MVVSMRVMPAGRGYEYLLKSVATGDRDRDLGAPLTRIATRTAAIPEATTAEQRKQATSAIREEETQRKSRQPVAGFDFTFSPPKSASTLWAVADAGTQSPVQGVIATGYDRYDSALRFRFVFLYPGHRGSPRGRLWRA